MLLHSLQAILSPSHSCITLFNIYKYLLISLHCISLFSWREDKFSGVPVYLCPCLPLAQKSLTHMRYVFDISMQRCVGHTAWAPEGPKAGGKGRQLEVGAQRPPRLLLSYIAFPFSAGGRTRSQFICPPCLPLAHKTQNPNLSRQNPKQEDFFSLQIGGFFMFSIWTLQVSTCTAIALFKWPSLWFLNIPEK